ncbi:MAG: hypothetical protein AB1921_05230, partial [Thermodesulfobacteriota bacterium]
PAALPVPACGTLSCTFGAALHDGHRPRVRGKSVMDAPDAARLVVARSIPEKRLAHLAKSLALAAPENAGPGDLARSLADSMIPLAEILDRLEPFELKNLARTLGVPAPRPNGADRPEAVGAMMQKLKAMD